MELPIPRKVRWRIRLSLIVLGGGLIVMENSIIVLYPMECNSIWRVTCGARSFESAFLFWDSNFRETSNNRESHSRNIILVDWCCMCKCSDETADHWLIHCISGEWVIIFLSSLFLEFNKWCLRRSLMCSLGGKVGLEGIEVFAFGMLSHFA